MSYTLLVKKYIDSVDGMAHQSAIEIIINLEKKLEAAYERGFVDGVKNNSESRVTKFMDKEWVGLTDEDREECLAKNEELGWWGVVNAIEQSLKEKNGG